MNKENEMPKMIAALINGRTIYDMRDGRAFKGSKHGDIVITEAGIHQVMERPNKCSFSLWYICDSADFDLLLTHIRNANHDAALRDLQRTQDAMSRGGY